MFALRSRVYVICAGGGCRSRLNAALCNCTAVWFGNAIQLIRGLNLLAGLTHKLLNVCRILAAAYITTTRMTFLTTLNAIIVLFKLNANIIALIKDEFF
jgi:hypothetical protein